MIQKNMMVGEWRMEMGAMDHGLFFFFFFFDTYLFILLENAELGLFTGGTHWWHTMGDTGIWGIF